VKKVSVIPFSENFLQKLAEELFCRHFSADDPLALAQVTVLLPHRRGALYLKNYLFQLIGAKHKQPFLPPHIVAIEDFVEEVAVQLENPPRRPLSPPDQAWILFEIVREISCYGRVTTSWDRFFPWGIRLASLLEELDRELVTPRGILYPEDVPQEARALLEGIETLYLDFDRHLREKGFTTKGKRFRLVAERIEEAHVGEAPIFLAGFYALTGSEERIFHSLFSNGAKIFWHADPEELPPLYRRWKEEWDLEIELGDKKTSSTHLYFYEAFDLHAELLQVKKKLPQEVQRADQCALVLPDPSALVPTFYILPKDMPVNITLGYPLERTALFSLLEQLMRLQEGRDERGEYYHQDYLTLVRHPYVRRLYTPSGNEARIILHLLEEKIRYYGKPFLSKEEVLNLLTITDDPERDRSFLAAEGLTIEDAVGFIQELHRHLLTPWEDLQTSVELAAGLREVVFFLFAPFLREEESLHNYPLDNEFIYTLGDSVIPILEESLFSQQPMGKKLSFSLLREVVHLARTPFEGHPLVGLQVLGLLETRLLSFDKVIVVDVNEEVIPAQEEVNPLLPESIRAAIGLKGKEQEEAIYRYHFEHLIYCANEVHLFWQASSLPSSSGLEGKKVRSRFIEKLLWQQEKTGGTLLEDSVVKAPLHISEGCFVKEGGLKKREDDCQKVRQFLFEKSHRDGISASLLNTYLLCPLQFYYHYLLELSPMTSIPENVDSASLGEIIHKSLEDYFAIYRRKTYLKTENNDLERLKSIFLKHFRGSLMYSCLAPEKRFFLENAAAYRLKRYLFQMPEVTFVDGLEKKYRLTIHSDRGDFSLYGKVDRIDKRDGFRIILDYKTGRVESFAKGHFERRLLPFSPPVRLDYDGLKTVKGVIKDLQLPIYVFLVTSGQEKEVGKTLSAYVNLGKRGEELYFVTPDRLKDIQNSYISWFINDFPALLAYLLTHMIEAPLFYPATQEEVCRFCEYECICRFSFA